MSETFEARNELERKLVAAQAGEIPGDEFMTELLTSEVFMPVYDDNTIGGIQKSTKAQPLTLEDEEGNSVLVIFTSPERARDFVKEFPGYGGGLLAEFKWILERVGSGLGITLNPGWEAGLDMEADMLRQLVAQSEASGD